MRGSVLGAVVLGITLPLHVSRVVADDARRAAAERSVVVEGRADARDLPAPENIERLIFFGERPDSEPSARQQASVRVLEGMLKERELLVERRRAQAIVQLERFVASEPETASETPDALLRLAELVWERARAAHLRDYETWQRTPARLRRPLPPVADLARPLALYDRILSRHEGFGRYDLVLYMKAYALLEAGRTPEALAVYRRIIDEFPGSRFQPDAHMAFAEWHFSGSYDYAAALAEYAQVRKHPGSELSDIALFKSAWCLWKLGRVGEAATGFREVLDLGGKLSAVSGERRRRLLELQDQALEYLIQVFTEDERNTASDLHRFLASIGGEKYAGQVLRRLSRAFFDQARYARAVEAYRMLLASDPNDARAPEYQRQVAAAYVALEDADQTIAAYETLVATYGPQSAWARNQVDPEVVARAQRAGERAVRVQAMRFHERAQKEKQQADFERAAKLYRVHLSSFQESDHAYHAAFYLAEILFHRLGKPAEAGEHYLRAAKSNPKGALTKDALYNAIVAFETVRTKELEGCRPGAAGKAAPGERASCAETATDKSFSEATALYMQLYPTDPEVPGILFRQGRLYFERGVFDPAIRQLGQLLEAYPRSQYAATAGELVLESFHRAQDYGNIELWARKLKSAPAFQNAESQRKLDALILTAIFKAGEQLAKERKHALAARAYLRAAEELPRDERAPSAYYNAGQEWQRAGDLEASAAAYDELIERHPGSAAGALGALAAAEMFESIAQFSDAARYYEVYARAFPKGERREDALYNAIVLRLAAGDGAQAARDGREFLQLFPASKSGDEVYFLIGRAHESDDQPKLAAETYRQYVKRGRDPNRRAEANTRLGLSLLGQGDRDGADKAFAAAGRVGTKADLTTGRYYVAQARFLHGDLALERFERVKIEGDGRSLGKRLAQKSELLREAAEIYSEVATLQVAEWLTAALFKIGRSYELFAEALRAAPVPESLSEVEQQAYRDELTKFIVPIEERALEAYEGGYRKAIELRVFNAWTQKLREALTRLNDVEYPPLREAGTALVASGSFAGVPAPYDGLRRDLAPRPRVAQAAGGGR